MIIKAVQWQETNEIEIQEFLSNFEIEIDRVSIEEDNENFCEISLVTVNEEELCLQKEDWIVVEENEESGEINVYVYSPQKFDEEFVILESD